MKQFFAGILVLGWSATTAFACWQTGGPPVVSLAVQSLNIRVTNNDRPQKGLRFELHKAITFNVEEARKTGAFEKQILKSATTDSLGLLSFGEVKPGKYWIFSGRLSDSVAVEVVAPTRFSVNKRIWYYHFGDGCFAAVAENVVEASGALSKQYRRSSQMEKANSQGPTANDRRPTTDD